jgi:putative DNA-invertase from lambdoid prophage Rac
MASSGNVIRVFLMMTPTPRVVRDLTTPTRRAMAGMLAVFAEFEREVLRERVRAGIAQARREGRRHGRPQTASLKADEVRRLMAERLNHSEIARRLGIGRSSVRRILAAG